MKLGSRKTSKLTDLKPQWLHILLAVSNGPLHGLEIMEEVSFRTSGRIHLWPGALYGATKSLSKIGYIRETEPPREAVSGGGRPRYYELTGEGREVLSAELRELEQLVKSAKAKRLLGRASA